MIDLPNDWTVNECGKTKLYIDPEGDVRFVYISDYFGGEDMVGIYWLEKDASEYSQEWKELGGYAKVREELQDRIDFVAGEDDG